VDQRTRRLRSAEAAFEEAFRSLRTHLLLSARESELKSLVVAGAVGGSGKTTVSLGLAESLAQAGKRVILVDGDLRRPGLHAIYGVPNQVGLSSILAEGIPDDDALHPTDVEGLLVLFAGPPVTDVPRFLGAEVIQSLIDRLKQRADFVIVDSAPIAACTDAVLLSTICDGVLLVVSAGRIPRGTERSAVKQLKDAGANIIGACLNRVMPQFSDAYYHYGRYYAPGAVSPDGAETGQADDLPPPE